MWQLVTGSPNIESAYQELLSEFDVEPELPPLHLANFDRLWRATLQIVPADVGTVPAVSALERPARNLFLRRSSCSRWVALSLRWRGFRATQATLQRFLSNDNGKNDAALVSRLAPVTAWMVNAADRHGLVIRPAWQNR